jgi:hypothetical protein
MKACCLQTTSVSRAESWHGGSVRSREAGSGSNWNILVVAYAAARIRLIATLMLPVEPWNTAPCGGGIHEGPGDFAL